jgi:hypothetical protein
MEILIYKRPHACYPYPETVVFVTNDCMGSVRSWSFDAVIGVGGIGQEPRDAGIAGLLTWIGIGPHKTGDPRRPTVTFDHFRYFGTRGPLLARVAPSVARRMYGNNARIVKDSLTPAERVEAETILKLAKGAPSSVRAKNGNAARSTCDSKRSACR